MTALDTTNLRLAITVPPHGMVRFRLAGVVHGATTFPSILLGVMNGATVLGRQAPVQSLGNTAVATALLNVEVDFIVPGLTPGAMNVDAAYAVETLIAATGLKYGGPNNTTANDAFGGFAFEAWDPQPQTANSTLAVDASGRVDLSKVAGTAQTAGDLKASLNTLQADTDDIQTRLPAALVSGRMDASVGAMAANVLTATAIAADAITDAKVASDVTIASVTGAVGSVTGNIGGNVVGSVGSLAAQAKADVNAEADTALLDVGVTATVTGRIDAAVSTRLATAGYTAPLTAATTRSAVGLASANLDTQLVAIAGYIDTEVGALQVTADAIKAKTDKLTFTVGTKLDVNVLCVNGSYITGSGTALSPWGPV